MSKPPSLLNLPPEVRLRIYHLLLHHESWICMRRMRPPCQRLPNALHPAILATCRLIHNEAISVLYEENLFIEGLIDEQNSNAKFIKRQKLMLPPPTEEGAMGEM